MYGCPVISAPMAVPESAPAITANVTGRWHGQIANAPITQAQPRLSNRLPRSEHVPPPWLIGTAAFGPL